MHAPIDPITGEPAKALTGNDLSTAHRNLQTVGHVVTAMLANLDRAAAIAGTRPACFHEVLPSGAEAKRRGVQCHTSRLAADVAQALELLLPQAERLAKCCNHDLASTMAVQRGLERDDVMADAIAARAAGKA